MGLSNFMYVVVLVSCTVLSADSIEAVFSIKSNPLNHGKGTNPSITATYSLSGHRTRNPLNRKRKINQCVFHFMLFHKNIFMSWEIGGVFSNCQI